MNLPAGPTGPATEVTADAERSPAPRRAGPGGGLVTVAALGAWVVLVAVAWSRAEPYRALWKLRGAPLAGFFDRHVSISTVVVLAVGLALARFLPVACQRLSWRRLLAVAALAGVAWGGALALTRGVDGLDRGMAHRHEYPAIVATVDEVGLGTFIDTFTDEDVLATYPIHVQGHPLGISLAYVGLDRIGLAGAGWASAFTIAVGALAIPAVLTTVREVGGEHRARRAAPYLALAPAMVWAVTSADQVFAAVGAWAIALMVLATAAHITPRRRAALGIGSGVAWGVGAHLSYGLAPVALVGLIVVAWRRRWDVLGWVALGGMAVVSVFVGIGFWWFDGLAATRLRYEAGIASVRPRRFFTFIGNPAAFSIALGPAVYVALVRVRDAGLWLVAAGGLGAALVANASGLSKAEVERIWLPFVPWVLVLTAGLAALGRRGDGPPGPSSRWSWSPAWPALAANLLVVQVVVAVIVESVVKTPW